MGVRETALPGVLILEERVHRDERGWFREAWHAERARAAGITAGFVQDNVSFSHRGVLRGLHYQREPHAQGKLVAALAGEIFDVAVDVRPTSPTFGRWVGERLSAENGRHLWVPPGYAHGFVVLSESALVAYKCTAPYEPSAERSIRWDDPAIGIEWPVRQPLLSAKDATAPLLAAASGSEP